MKETNEFSRYTPAELEEIRTRVESAMRITRQSIVGLPEHEIPIAKLIAIDEYKKKIASIREASQPSPDPEEIDSEACKRSCVLVKNGDARGTAYFVTMRLAVTCAHVVPGSGSDSVQLAQPHLSGHPVSTGRVVLRDTDSDVAVLEVSGEDLPREVLHLGEGAQDDAPWMSCGFMESAGERIIRFIGTVHDRSSRDRAGRNALCLFSPQAAAGLASPLHGVSGSPVISGGRVVGHLSSALVDPEHAGRVSNGLLFAIPVPTIRSVLGRVSP